MAAVPLILLPNYFGEWYGVFALVVVTVVAIWASGRTQGLLGRKDPSEVVIDEVAGFLVTMLLLPISLVNVGLGFILFRFFDIVKPWPVRQSERLKGGVGIVVDDLLAGVYAHLCLRGILVFVT
jgi:phosphatidylglycerophosphatase A